LYITMLLSLKIGNIKNGWKILRILSSLINELIDSDIKYIESIGIIFTLNNRLYFLIVIFT